MVLIAPHITPLLITYNEEANIDRALEKLSWADRIVLVDSGSTDATLDIAARIPQVEIFIRAFDSFADQCNFGLAQVNSEWVLSLDADYILSDALVNELLVMQEPRGVDGFRIRFTYCIYGRPLRGSLYPPRTSLYRAARAKYVNEGHGHRVVVDGRVGSLVNVISHDDRKSLSRWGRSQLGYAEREADYLFASKGENLSRADRIRRLGWLAPLVILPYTLIIKGCLWDGAPGWYYALQRLFAEVIISLEILDRRLRGRLRDLSEAAGPKS